MQELVTGRPWLLEICPASVLKRDGLSEPFKGRTPSLAAARERILEAFERAGRVALPGEMRNRLLADAGGDALDSVIAAIATAEVLTRPEQLTCPPGHIYAREGRVLL
jgi:hypothetical protein